MFIVPKRPHSFKHIQNKPTPCFTYYKSKPYKPASYSKLKISNLELGQFRCQDIKQQPNLNNHNPSYSQQCINQPNVPYNKCKSQLRDHNHLHRCGFQEHHNPNHYTPISAIHLVLNHLSGKHSPAVLFL